MNDISGGSASAFLKASELCQSMISKLSVDLSVSICNKNLIQSLEVVEFFENLEQTYESLKNDIIEKLNINVSDIPKNFEISIPNLNFLEYDLVSILKPDVSKKLGDSDAIPLISENPDGSSHVTKINLEEILQLLPEKLQAADYIAELRPELLILWSKDSWDNLPADSINDIDWANSDYEEFWMNQLVDNVENVAHDIPLLKVRKVNSIEVLSDDFAERASENSENDANIVVAKITSTPAKLMNKQQSNDGDWTADERSCLNLLQYHLSNYAHVSIMNISKINPLLKQEWVILTKLLKQCNAKFTDENKINLVKQISVIEMMIGIVQTYNLRQASARYNPELVDKSDYIPHHIKRMRLILDKQMQSVEFVELSETINSGIYKVNSMMTDLLIDNIIDFERAFHVATKESHGSIENTFPNEKILDETVSEPERPINEIVRHEKTGLVEEVRSVETLDGELDDEKKKDQV